MFFFCHQPCFSFPLNAVKLSSFRLWSLHHFQQLHLHINELSHSYYNYFTEMVVLSPTCFSDLLHLSWLCKERLPRTFMKVWVQQQKTENGKRDNTNPFYTGLSKTRIYLFAPPPVYSVVCYCLPVLGSTAAALGSPGVVLPELAVQSI